MDTSPPRRIKRIHTIEEFREIARHRLPRMVFDFIEGGAEDEITARANLRAYSDWTFDPRVLVDVSNPILEVELFGRRYDLPVLLAPTGLAGLADPGGEAAAAAAAGHAGTAIVASTAASYTLEDIADATTGPSPWFQLYPWCDRDVTARLMERASAAGYETMMVTVDVPVVGARERDLRNGFTVPPRVGVRNALDALRHPRWLAGLARHRRITFANLRDMPEVPTDRALSLVAYAAQLNDPATDWDDFRWIRHQWTGSLLIKGVLSVDDAVRAVELGADGVVVSNHGGRQLDGGPATLQVLPEIAAAVGGVSTVLVDGGIRRGSDVIKALALGANACLIGRPFLYGLAAGGEAGVARTLEILGDEMRRTLALIGRPSVSELNRAALLPRTTVQRQASADDPPSTGSTTPVM